MFVIQVPSSRAGETHTVRKAGDVWVCSCRDHVFRSAGEPYTCGHIAAVAASLVTHVAGSKHSKRAEKAIAEAVGAIAPAA